MTMELVTGHAGEPHVTAAQDAALHAGVIGGDDYVLSTKDRFAINVVSANKVTIAGGDLVMQGYHASNDKPADLIITNGSQGQKRNDIICCRYTKVGDSIESANLVVVKGTPTTGTPVDPTLNTTPHIAGSHHLRHGAVQSPARRHHHRRTRTHVQHPPTNVIRVGFPNPDRSADAD